jgi:hypothetical protein
LFTPDDRKQAKNLLKIMREAKQDINPQLEAMGRTHDHGSIRRRWNPYRRY